MLIHLINFSLVNNIRAFASISELWLQSDNLKFFRRLNIIFHSKFDSKILSIFCFSNKKKYYKL